MGDTVWPRAFRFTNNRDLAVLNFGQSNDDGQVVRFNFANNQMQLITESVFSAGELGDGSSDFIDASADGRWIAFASSARNLITGYTGPTVQQMYRYDQNSGMISMISVNGAGLEASDPSRDPSVANDGRVVFTTESDFIVGRESNDETDIVLYDGGPAGPQLVSVSEGGGLADGRSQEAQISGDGRFVVFTSYATNLVQGDTNGRGDVFVRDLVNGRTEILTRDGDDHSRGAQISEDGRVIMFVSTANNLVPGDTVEFGLEIFVVPNPLHP